MVDYDALAMFAEKAKQGDMEAFRNLYDSTYKSLYFIIYKKINNKADTEDIMQETYVSAFRGINNLQNNRAVVKWLYQIAYQTMIRHLKEIGRIETVDIEEHTEIPADFSVENELIEKERSQEVIRIVNELPDKQREVIYLFYLQGFSTLEIAEMCQCSETVICKRLFDARKTMHKKLERIEGAGKI